MTQIEPCNALKMACHISSLGRIFMMRHIYTPRPSHTIVHMNSLSIIFINIYTALETNLESFGLVTFILIITEYNYLTLICIDYTSI